MSDEEQAPMEVSPNKTKDPLPSIEKTAFSCPHCGAYTHQFWYSLFGKKKDNKDSTPNVGGTADRDWIINSDRPPEIKNSVLKFIEKCQTGKVFFQKAEHQYNPFQVCNLHLSCCYTCKEISVWVHDRLLFPPKRTGPEPNEDLPDMIKATYEEARSILHLSPRGTAALLRLCIQNLCIHLGKDGKNLNKDIASLVSDGLDIRIQRALDIVRVIGNNAVHPGQIELQDDQKTATQLFKLVNLIADKMISERNTLNELYGSLPAGAIEAIEHRDQKRQ